MWKCGNLEVLLPLFLYEGLTRECVYTDQKCTSGGKITFPIMSFPYY